MIRGRGRSFWWGVSVLAAAVIVAVGWFVAIGPQLSDATTAREASDDLQLQNQVQRTKVTALEAQEPAPLRASLTEAVAALPYLPNLPTYTRQLTVQAQQTGVTIDSITIGAASAVTATDAAAGGATAGTVLSVPVTVSSTGLGDRQRAFLQALQVEGPRRALVTAVQLSPKGGDDGTTSGRSSMTLTLTVFVAPLDAAAQTQLQQLLAGGSTS